MELQIASKDAYITPSIEYLNWGHEQMFWVRYKKEKHLAFNQLLCYQEVKGTPRRAKTRHSLLLSSVKSDVESTLYMNYSLMQGR